MRVRLALVMALAGFGLASPGPARAEPVAIGIAAPLTGPDAIFGTQIKLGVDQAIADFGGQDGWLSKGVRVVPRDDGNDPKKGVEVAKRFVADKVKIVIGHLSSAVTVPASDIYAEAGALEITPTAEAPAVTDRGVKMLFRTCGREDQQAGVAARYLIGRHVARVAVVYDRTSTGKAFADAVRQALSAAGIKDVFYGSLEKGARDFGSLVPRLKASNAQVVVWGGGSTEAGLLVRQLRDARSKAVLMGGLAMAGDDFASNAGDAADGSLIVFPRDPRTQPAAADLLKRLQAKGANADSSVFYTYAAMQVLRQAAETSNSLAPEKLAATMHSEMIFKTVLGDLSFDEKGDPTRSDLIVYVWHKGASGRMVFDDPAKS